VSNQKGSMSSKEMCVMANGYMIVVGTRPEIIKMAPILRAFKKESLPYTFVHCGQHYDYEMSQQFIDELELPKPDYGFKVKAYSPSVQTAKIMILIENVVKKVKPDVVLVEGDTNGVLASALATVKLGVPVGHVEAGLRSYDLRMPEEYNRRLVDHISSYLFAPTENAEQNLKLENVWGKTFVTGNTVIDAVKQHLPLAKQKSKILDESKFEKFALVTAHRAENVDNPTVLKDFVESFIHAPIPIIYPIHPRTRKQLHKQKLWKTLFSSENVQILPPIGYFDFLILMKNCEMIITDSGGIQEEATAPQIRKPVLVTRISTERPEAVEAGFAKIVGVKKNKIITAMKQTLNEKHEFPQRSPYGNGASGELIVEILRKTHFSA